jgi:DNA-binding beta-propeller fold protein YncE
MRYINSPSVFCCNDFQIERAMNDYSRMRRLHRAAPLAAVTLGMLGGVLAGCLPDRGPTAPVSIERPNPKYMSPGSGELIVPRVAPVRMAFTEPMDLNTFPGHFVLRDFSGIAVSGSFSAHDTSVLFLPTQQLQPSALYEATLRGRVRNARNMTVQLNNEPVFDDTTLLMTTWFYTEGAYSDNGFFPVYLRDRKEEKVRFFGHLDSALTTAPTPGAPEGMAVTADGSWIYVAGTTQDNVLVVNTQTAVVDKAISVAQYPSAVAAYGTTVAVISINGRALTKIDAGSQTVSSTASLTFYPARLAVSNDGATLFTFDQVTRDLVLLRESDGTVIKRVAGAFTQLVAGDIVVDGSSGLVYVCDAKGLKIKSTDAAGSAFQTVRTFGAGIEPVALAFSPTIPGEYYVAAGKFMFKCALSDAVPLDTLALSAAVKSVAVVPSGDILYATYGSDVVIVDARTFTLLKDIQLTSSGLEGVLVGPNKK